MARKPESALTGYASVSVTHHALGRERADMLRRRKGRPASKPECLTIGHAWTEDPARSGGRICIVCAAVKRP